MLLIYVVDELDVFYRFVLVSAIGFSDFVDVNEASTLCLMLCAYLCNVTNIFIAWIGKKNDY